MRARITFLASDRLQGRATPSRGLDIAAAYVASEFRRFGLESPLPGYAQRYSLVRTELGDSWAFSLSRGSRRATLRYGEDFWGLPWAAGSVEGELRFVGSPPSQLSETGESIWVVELSRRVSARGWNRAAVAAGATGLVLTFPEAARPYVGRWLESGGTRFELGDLDAPFPALLVSEAALAAALERLGLELPAKGVADARVAARARLKADLGMETLTAPNVIGVVRGGDRRLREEYVVVSAHMDGLGIGSPVEGDSIYNGADDNASGTAALLEVAEAVAALDEPPKRSILFVALSGEESGLLGSGWFVEHPPVPLDRMVANLNIDMIGRNWEDTIAVIGKPYSSLGALVDSVAVAHPELGLTVVGDIWPDERFFFRSDHYNFARKGVPALFFINGVHEDYHLPSDEVEKIKFEKAARISRLVFEAALAVANAEKPPSWDPRAQAQIVEREP